MARLCVYADESGNFDFSRGPKASLFFVLTTVVIEDHSVGHELLNLRRELAWQGHDLRREFHATEDKQVIRDAVFRVLEPHPFRVDATILFKPKTQPQVRVSDMRFYKTAWFYHMRYLAPRIASRRDDLLVIAASLGTSKKRVAFRAAIDDVMKQVSPTRSMQTAFWPAAVDPCLQVADYCSWAIQRRWEYGDPRSHELILPKIRTEYDLFKTGTTLHY